jgi:uncharacterized OB-fold protein
MKKTAKLIEFSRNKDDVFCIAEFEGNIRIMGTIEDAKNLKIGQLLTLAKCDYDGTEKFILKSDA